MSRRSCLLFIAVVLACIGSKDQLAFAVVTDSLRSASTMSSSSGKPMFVVYGTQSCPYCVKLMDRLKSDESLSEFGDAFVVLKVDRDDPDWPRFDQQYDTDRNAVPRLYIIASDGTAIVKQVGAPSGDGLPRMLSSALEQAGPMLPPGRVAMVQKAAELVAELNPTEDWPAVAGHLLKVESDLMAGNAFCKPLADVKGALQMANDTMMHELEQARTKLADDTDDLESLATWAKVSLLQGVSPQRKRDAASLMSDLKRWKTDRKRIDVAIDLAEAELLSLEPISRMQKRATDKLALIIKSSDDPDAVTLAKQSLAKINPDLIAELEASPGETSPLSTDSDYRTWTAKAGNFSKTAKMLQANATHVQLQDRDGQTMTVRLDQLSDADQAYAGQAAE